MDGYIKRAGRWSEALATLREIVNSTTLVETVKWGVPCYTHEGRNVVAIVAFKNYCGLWFYDAEELDDPRGVLQQAEGGTSQAMKQWRFEANREIKRAAIKPYLQRAKAAAEQPKKAKPPMPKAKLAPELALALTKNKQASEAFDNLTPGKQREYSAHIAEAKRDATKMRRIEKILPMILEGQGLNNRYQ